MTLPGGAASTERGTNRAAKTLSLARRQATRPHGITLLAVLALAIAAFLWQVAGAHWAEAAADLETRSGGQPAHAIAAVPVLPPQEWRLPATADHPAYALYAPGGPAVTRTALVVLHGIGGDGPAMASYILPIARAH